MTKLDWILLAMAKAWALTSPIAGATPRDIASAIEVACVEKPLFAGIDGWRESAAFEIGIAVKESGFRQVAGDCKGLRAGSTSCGSPGTTPQSWCFLQIYLPDGKRTAEGWSGQDLLSDPLKCARAAREIIRRSITSGPPGEPLKLYAGSSKGGASRFALAKQIYGEVAWTP